MSRPKRRGIGRKMRRSVQGGRVGGSQLCCLLPPANGWQPKSESGCRSDWSTVVVIFCLLHVAYQLFWLLLPFLSLSKVQRKFCNSLKYIWGQADGHLSSEWNSWSVNHLSRPILPASNSCYGGKKGSSDESVIMIIIPLLSLNIMQDSCRQALFRIVISSST